MAGGTGRCRHHALGPPLNRSPRAVLNSKLPTIRRMTNAHLAGLNLIVYGS